MPRAIFRKEATAWVVLAVSLAITFLASYLANEHLWRRAEDRFLFEVADARERITRRMLHYEQVLRGGVSLFHTLDGRVSRAQWRRYVEGLQTQTFYPGIQGIGFALMLTPDQLPGHIAAVREEGFADYAVTPEGVRERYAAIVYLEPFDARNRRAFGFDMLSEPVRRSAMEQARDTGLPAVSGRVTLVQETGQDLQPGFLMYLPVFRPGLPTETVEQRREALLGFVYSPFRMHDLMQGILGSDNAELGFELFDGDAPPHAESRLYSSDAGEGGEPAHRATSVIPLPGGAWTARFHSSPWFDAAVRSAQPLAIALGGLVVDILLFAVIRSLAGERRRVQRKAEAMTAELRAGHRRLEESERRLTLAEEVAGLGSWRWDPVERAWWWSDGFYRLLGAEPQAFKPSLERLRDFLPPAERARVEGVMQRAFWGGEATFEHSILRLDGQERRLQVRGRAVWDASGELIAHVGTALDITDRKRAEQALAAEHALLQSIVDAIPDLVVHKDADLVYRTVNAAFLRFIQKPREEILGKSDYDLFPRAEADHYRSDDRRILATGEPLTLVEHVTGPDEKRWFQVAKVPLPGADGGVRGVLMSVRDISVLKSTEEDLRRRHAELEAVFATSHVMIAIMDRQFRFLRVNAAYAAAAGTQPETLIGQGHFDLFPHAENEAIFRRVKETGAPFAVCAKPFELPHQPGLITYWDWTLSPLRGADGGVEGLILTLIDVTERERRRQEAEEAWRHAQAALEQRVRERTFELQAANRELQIANRELESFSYSVSHDLRGPLRAINGFAEALREDCGAVLDETGRGYLDRLREATLRMSKLIDGLLGLARVIRSDMVCEPVDLSAHAGEIARALTAGAPQRAVEWSIEPGITVTGDPTLLHAVLQNLLENAWKFTLREAVARIAFGRERRGDRELLFIRDNGAGFDAKYAHKLFEPFERLHTSAEYEGTGIGLATVRRIVERHGGEVWAEGSPGLGATLYLYFPPDAARVARALAAEEAPPDSRAERRMDPAMPAAASRACKNPE